MDRQNKYDAGKRKISLVPPTIIYDIAEGREYGNNKYGDKDGWKTVEPQRYIDALLRHTLEFMRDPLGRDAESGIAHYKHMACNTAFLCEFFRESPRFLHHYTDWDGDPAPRIAIKKNPEYPTRTCRQARAVDDRRCRLAAKG